MAEQDVGGIIAHLRLDAEAFSAAITEAKGAATGLGEEISKVGESFKVAAGVTAAYAGSIALATKSAGNFEQQMADVGAVLNVSTDQLGALREIALSAGKTTEFSASQAAGALLELSKAGLKTSGEFRDALIPTLNLASAAHADIKTAVDSVDAALRVFNLKISDSSRLTNLFAAATATGQMSLSDLQEAMVSAGPTASLLGQQIEDVTAILRTLAEMGIRGRRAGMSLKQVFLDLANPSKEVADILQRQGISLGELSSLISKPVELFKRLHDANLSTAEAQKIFGNSGIALFSIIKNGVPELESLRNGITGTDAASRMAAQRMDTFNGSFKELRGTIEGLVIKFGSALLPIVRAWVDDVKGGVANLSDWITGHQALIQVLVVEVGKFLLLVTAITGAVKAWTTISAALEVVKTIQMGVALATSTATASLLAQRGAALIAGKALAGLTAVAPWLALAAAIAYVGDKILDWKEKQIDATSKSNALAASNRGLADSFARVASELEKTKGKTDELTAANEILERNGMRPNIKSHEDLERRIKGLQVAANERMRQDGASASESKKNSSMRMAAAQAEMGAVVSGSKKESAAQESLSMTEADAAALAVGYTQQEMFQYQQRKTALLVLAESGKVTWSDYYTWLATEGQKFNDTEALRILAWQDFQNSVLQGAQSAWSSTIDSMISGTVSFTDGVKGLWEGLKSSVIKAIADMAAKWMAFSMLKGVLGLLGGVGGAIFGGLFSGGGMVPGAQGGFLPASEDMLIGVQSGEAVLSQRGVAAVGGPGGVASINKGAGSGDTFIFNVKSLTGQIDQASADYVVKCIQQAKRQYAGVIA